MDALPVGKAGYRNAREPWPKRKIILDRYVASKLGFVMRGNGEKYNITSAGISSAGPLAKSSCSKAFDLPVRPNMGIM